MVAAISSAAACASTGHRSPDLTVETEPSTTTPSPNPNLDSRRTVDGHRLEDLEQEARTALANIARARNLDVIGEVKVRLIDRPEIRRFAERSLNESIDPETLRIVGQIQASLGIIPEHADPERLLLDMLEEGIWGIYDPKTQTLLIGDFVPKPLLPMVIGHEVAHGLQDMHFDLSLHQEPLPHRSDAEAARRYLIEGEAQAAYLAWTSGAEGLGRIGESVLNALSDQALQSAALTPYPILARELQMPYGDGTATIVRLVLEQGWGAVDALYRDLPQTSEQMLHIDKLLAREGPISLAIDTDSVGRALTMKPVWHDQVGEASLLAILADASPIKVARQAAAGWGGDALIALRTVDAPTTTLPTILIATAWDSVEDAAEFASALQSYSTKALPKSTMLTHRGTAVIWVVRIPDGVSPSKLEAALWDAIAIDKGQGA